MHKVGLESLSTDLYFRHTLMILYTYSFSITIWGHYNHVYFSSDEEISTDHCTLNHIICKLSDLLALNFNRSGVERKPLTNDTTRPLFTWCAGHWWTHHQFTTCYSSSMRVTSRILSNHITVCRASGRLAKAEGQMLQLVDLTGHAGLCWRSPASLSEAKYCMGRVHAWFKSWCRIKCSSILSLFITDFSY